MLLCLIQSVGIGNFASSNAGDRQRTLARINGVVGVGTGRDKIGGITLGIERKGSIANLDRGTFIVQHQ